MIPASFHPGTASKWGRVTIAQKQVPVNRFSCAMTKRNASTNAMQAVLFGNVTCRRRSVQINWDFRTKDLETK